MHLLLSIELLIYVKLGYFRFTPFWHLFCEIGVNQRIISRFEKSNTKDQFHNSSKNLSHFIIICNILEFKKKITYDSFIEQGHKMLLSKLKLL